MLTRVGTAVLRVAAAGVEAAADDGDATGVEAAADDGDAVGAGDMVTTAMSTLRTPLATTSAEDDWLSR